MRLGKTTLIHFASQVGVSLAGFVATFAIARLLGADTLGVYTVVVAVVFWLNVPTAAVSTAVNKRVSEGVDRGTYLSSGFLVNGLVGGILALGVVTLSEYVNHYIGAEVGVLLATVLMANVAFSTVLNALSGQKRVAQSGLLQAFERVGRTSGQVALILLGFELSGLLVGHAASMIVAAVVGVALFGVRPSMPSREAVWSLVGYARYSWLGMLKTRAFAWMDTIVLAFFVPSTLIGIYEVAWTLASTLALVSLSVQQTLFPELSELGVEDNYERIHHYLNEGLTFTGVFAIPGFFGALVLGTRLLKIYRPEFTQGATILLILIAARTVAAFGSQFLSAINAVDRPDVAFRVNLAFVAVNLVLNVVLVWQYGWYGAAVATATSALLSVVLGYVALTRLIGPPDVPFGEILREVAAGATMGGVVYALTAVFPRSHYGTVALVGVGAVVYTLVLVAISTRVRSKALALLPVARPA